MQITIVKADAQNWVNGRVEGREEPLFHHLVECLVPTATVMNQMVAEEMVRITGPVKNDWDKTHPEDRFEYRMESGQSIIYDFKKTVHYAKEKVVRITEMLAGEKTVPKPDGKKMEKEKIWVTRRRNREDTRHEIECPMFTTTSMPINQSTGGEFLHRNSVSLMANMTEKIKGNSGNNQQLFSRYLTSEAMTGYQPAGPSSETDTGEKIVIEGPPAKILMAPKTGPRVMVSRIDPEKVKLLGIEKLNPNRERRVILPPDHYRSRPKTFKRDFLEKGESFTKQLLGKDDKTTKVREDEEACVKRQRYSNLDQNTIEISMDVQMYR